MDITRGEFVDFSSRPSSKLSSHSRLSSRESMTCSMEILPPEMDKVSDDQIQTGLDLLHCSSDEEELADLSENQGTKIMLHRLRSSMSSHSTISNSSGQNGELSEGHMSSEDFELHEAIKHMNKLDRILKKKLKLEREVRKQRLLYQKQMHADLEQLKEEKGENKYSDIESNTTKYLSLLPPLQQLDVLLERNESSEVTPIFPTQIPFGEECDKSKLRVKSAQSEGSRTKQGANADNISTGGRKPSSAASKCVDSKSEKNKTDFVQRNIELAKDAGNFVAMTEDEKKRLKELLKEVDDMTNEDEDGDSPELALWLSDGGYSPDKEGLERLEAIDKQLQNLLSPEIFRSISSTPRSDLYAASQLTSDISSEAALRFLKCDLTETLTPEQRLKDVEEKLLDLDQKWKHQFSDSQPQLTDDQLSALLAECSRTTSPRSVTASLQRLPSDDGEESEAASPRSTSTLRPDSIADCDVRSQCDQDVQDVVLAKPAPLSRDVLDRLLHEAKRCLGLSDACEETREPESESPVEREARQSLERDDAT